MMRTEPGQIQTTQGLLASFGAISDQPLVAEGDMFATLFGQSLPVSVPGKDPVALAEAAIGTGAVWPVLAPAAVVPVDPPSFASDQVEFGETGSTDPRLEAGSVPLAGSPAVGSALPEGKVGLTSAPAEPVGPGFKAARILPDPTVVPVPEAGWTAPDVTTRSSSASGLVHSDTVINGVPKGLPFLGRQAVLPLAEAIVDPAAVASESGKHVLSRRPEVAPGGLPAQRAPDVDHDGVGDPAVPAVCSGPSASDGPAVPAVPAVPAMKSAMSAVASESKDGASAVLASLQPDPSSGRTFDRKIDNSPDDAGLGRSSAPSPLATEAERVWLGSLQWQNVLAAEGARFRAHEGTPHHVGAEVPEPDIRAGHVPGAVELTNVSPLVAAVEAAEPEERLHPFAPDPFTATLSPPGQLSQSGGAVAGPLPGGTLSPFVASVVATLHQKADGTTEIALSPDELGSVRLRLEADIRDPERMIVHLVFDRPETMDLFRRHADQLSEAIRAAGYAEARLDFGQSGMGADERGRPGLADNEAASPDSSDGTQAHARLTPDKHFPRWPANTAGLDLRL